jgi:hypothetical protein
MAKSSADASSSSSSAKILMAVAVVAIVGLLAWLSFASEPSTTPAVSLDTLDAGPGAATSPPVAAADFGANMESYTGQEIELRGVVVAQVMSPEIIWVDVPTSQGAVPFPVKLAVGITAPGQGATVNIEGRVLEKTDSVVDAWEQSGAIQNAGQRSQAEYGPLFIEARVIRQAGSD